MTPTQAIIRRARRRTVIARMLDRAGRGAIFGLIAAIPVLALDRLLGLGQPWWLFALIPGLGLLAGAALALVRLPDPVEIGVLIDRGLNLKDRIGTAVAMRIRPTAAGTGPVYDDAFSQLAERDAEHWASRIDVRSVTPIEITSVWRTVALLAAVVAGGFLFIPSATWGADAVDPEALAAQREQAERQRAQVAGAIEEVRESVPRDLAGEDPDLQENLDALDRLADQLSPGADEPPQPGEIEATRDEAAARMNDVAETLDRRADRDAAALNDLTKRFAGMQSEREAPMTAEQFARALKRGDYGDAAALLEQLLAEREAMSEQERADAAKYIRDLSSQLDAMSEQDRRTLEEQAEQLRQALRDQGLTDDQIDELNDAQTPEEMERDLRESGVDEHVARELADDLEEQREREHTQERTDARSEALSESFDRAADELEHPPTSPTPPSDPADPAAQEPSDPDAQQGEEQPPADDAAQPQQGDPQTPEQRTGEQQQTGEQQTSGEQQQTGDQQTGGEQQQTGEQQTGGEQQQTGDQQTGGEQQQTGEQQTGAQPTGEQQAGEQQGDPQSGEPGMTPPQPGQQPGAQPAASDQQSGDPREEGQPAFDPDAQPTPGGEGDQPLPTKDDLERFREWAAENPGAVERLRKMAEQMQGTEEGQQQAERLREHARELMESMSEEERQRWAEQWQQQSGEQPPEDGPQGGSDRSTNDGEGTAPGLTPGTPPDADEPAAPATPAQRSETIDLTGETIEGETIAEWLDDAPPAEGAADATARTVTTRLREARRVAERAVDDAAIPQRYHDLIKRYFRRLNESAGHPPTSAPPGASGAQGGAAANGNGGGQSTSGNGQSGGADGS